MGNLAIFIRMKEFQNLYICPKDAFIKLDKIDKSKTGVWLEPVTH